MAKYKIDQKKKSQNIKGIQKTRLIWLISSAILLITPMLLMEPVGGDGGSIFRDLVIYILWIIVLALFFYFSVPKMLNQCKIELKDDMISSNVNYWIVKNQKPISLERVRVFHETANGISLYTRWKKIWIPESLKNFDELKAEIISRIHPNAMRWYRLPTLWFWLSLGVLGLAAAIFYKDIMYAYTAIVVSAAGISFVFFLE